MANTRGRVTIPENVEEQLQLAELVYAKHQDQGSASPLKVMEDVNWDNIGPNLENVKAKHLQAEELRRQMELAYAEREAMMIEITNALRSTRNMLKGIYSSSPHMLSNWGFEVDNAKHGVKNAPDTHPS
jgi:hypothetical protein